MQISVFLDYDLISRFWLRNVRIWNTSRNWRKKVLDRNWTCIFLVSTNDLFGLFREQPQATDFIILMILINLYVFLNNLFGVSLTYEG